MIFPACVARYDNSDYLLEDYPNNSTLSEGVWGGTIS
jgi:hypothetical protein